ncbi:phage antirepressor KilAC domain-containing protein [Glycomyces paridis]|nr:phage antirepressor KilAC domain-containing protein [Glycomyces paridis]
MLDTTPNRIARANPPQTPGADEAVPPFEAVKRTDANGEHWLARELMPILGYGDWQRVRDVVERAVVSCRLAGGDPDAEFTRVVLASDEPGGLERRDLRFTRRAACFIALNGDPRKPAIAAARAYFAIDTGDTGTEGALDEIEAARRYLAALESKRDLQVKLADLAPDAASWQVLASANGDFSVADAAKILSRDAAIEVGQTRLFQRLRDINWTFRQSGDGAWRAYQRSIDGGWLSELPQSHYHPRTGELVLDPPRLRVTAKGLAELRRRLTESALVRERSAGSRPEDNRP